MSGTFIVMPLVSGQLSGNLDTLLSVGIATYLKQWLLFNEGPPVITTLYTVPSGGTPVPFRRVVLGMQESYQALEHGESLTLSPGDAIAAQANYGNQVDYTLSGVQET